MNVVEVPINHGLGPGVAKLEGDYLALVRKYSCRPIDMDEEHSKDLLDRLLTAEATLFNSYWEITRHRKHITTVWTRNKAFNEYIGLGDLVPNSIVVDTDLVPISIVVDTKEVT